MTRRPASWVLLLLVGGCGDPTGDLRHPPRDREGPVSLGLTAVVPASPRDDRVNVFARLRADRHDVGALQSYLRYDPARLSYLEHASAADAFVVVNADQAAGGELRFAATAAAGLQDRSIAFGFRSLDRAFLAGLRLNPEILATLEGELLQPDVFSPTDAEPDTAEAEVAWSSGPARKLGARRGQAAPGQPGDPAPGDCRTDGVIDVLDAARIVSIGVGLDPSVSDPSLGPAPASGTPAFRACDVDGTGRIDVLDAVVVRLRFEPLPPSEEPPPPPPGEPPPPRADALVFSDGFEGADHSSWATVDPIDDMSFLSRERAHTGRGSAWFRGLAPGDPLTVEHKLTAKERTMVKLLHWGPFDDGAEYLSSAWYYWPESYDVHPMPRHEQYVNIMQWKEREAPWNPLWVVAVDGSSGVDRIVLHDWNGVMTGHDFHAPETPVEVPKGRWFNVTASYRADPARGKLELWLDGERILALTDVPTMTRSSSSNAFMFGVGNYGWPAIGPGGRQPRGLFVDDVEVWRVTP